MKEPTLENLREERNQYRAHLDAGGKPITLTLILHPSDEGLDWMIEGHFPKPLENCINTIMFASYIKEQIQKAIQPPSDEPTRQGNN